MRRNTNYYKEALRIKIKIFILKYRAFSHKTSKMIWNYLSYVLLSISILMSLIVIFPNIFMNRVPILYEKSFPRKLTINGEIQLDNDNKSNISVEEVIVGSFHKDIEKNKYNITFVGQDKNVILTFKVKINNEIKYYLTDVDLQNNQFIETKDIKISENDLVKMKG